MYVDKYVDLWAQSAEAGGRANVANGARKAVYLFIRPRRKSPCIYFEWAARRGAGHGQTLMPVWRQKDSPAPRASRARGHPPPLSDTGATPLI